VYSAGDGRRDGEWDVYILDAESGENQRVTTNPGPDWACDWSPDGEWLLIASAYAGNWDIYAIRPDGSERTRITCHAGNARYASWAHRTP
jgi:TolB protein